MPAPGADRKPMPPEHPHEPSGAALYRLPAHAGGSLANLQPLADESPRCPWTGAPGRATLGSTLAHLPPSMPAHHGPELLCCLCQGRDPHESLCLHGGVWLFPLQILRPGPRSPTLCHFPCRQVGLVESVNHCFCFSFFPILHISTSFALFFFKEVLMKSL